MSENYACESVYSQFCRAVQRDARCDARSADDIAYDFCIDLFELVPFHTPEEEVKEIFKNLADEYMLGPEVEQLQAELGSSLYSALVQTGAEHVRDYR